MTQKMSVRVILAGNSFLEMIFFPGKTVKNENR
jgi:hypothetical protein